MGVQVTVYPRGVNRVRASGPLGVLFDTYSRRVGNPLIVEQYGELVSVNAGTRYEQGFGGHDLASWTVKPHGGYVGGLMRPGDHVRITKGGGTVFEGEFSEAEPADDGTITLHAKGYAHNLYDYDSIYWHEVLGGDDVYYPTTLLGPPGDTGDTLNGWGYAIQRLGMPINNVVGDVSAWTDPFGDSDMATAPIKLGDLVTSVHQEAGERWAVWGRTLVLGADPTTPMWSYSPPAGVVGVADTDYATHVFVWFVSSSLSFVQPWVGGTAYVTGDVVAYDGTWWKALTGSTGFTPVEGSTWTEVPVAYRKGDFSMVVATDTPEQISRFDTRTVVVDYRGLGPMSDVRALNLGQQLLDQVKGRFILTGGFTVAPDSGFCSAGGGVADVAFVRAGEMLKMPGLRTDQGNLMDTDTTIVGQTSWSWSAAGAESLQVTPMGSVPRSLSEILKGSPLDAASVVSRGSGR
jgi:hypothetical protein